MTVFYKNYCDLCAKKEMSVSGVAAAIGLSNAAANGWKKGKQPSDTTLAKLAAYFGVSVSDLTEDKEKPTTENGSELSKETIQMLLDKMSAAELVELMGDITDTLKRRH